MRAPQIVMVILLTLNVARGWLKHGQPDGKVDGRATVIASALYALLLWWGGFWAVGAR